MVLVCSLIWDLRLPTSSCYRKEIALFFFFSSYIHVLRYWDNDQLVISNFFFLQCVYWNQGYTDNENQSDDRTDTIVSNIFKSSQSNVLFTNPAPEMSSTKQFIVWVTNFSKHAVITFLDVNYRCNRTQDDQLPVNLTF